MIRDSRQTWLSLLLICFYLSKAVYQAHQTLAQFCVFPASLIFSVYSSTLTMKSCKRIILSTVFFVCFGDKNAFIVSVHILFAWLTKYMHFSFFFRVLTKSLTVSGVSILFFFFFAVYVQWGWRTVTDFSASQLSFFGFFFFFYFHLHIIYTTFVLCTEIVIVFCLSI